MANKKLGIFGGSFNPVHVGHLNSLKTVKETLGLDELRVVPAFQSPNRELVEHPTPDQRMTMLKLSLEGQGPSMVVDECELKRGGVSYTVDTLNHFRAHMPEVELYLIIGLDQFEYFDHWKDYESILEMANLVVTSRSGGDLPTELESLADPLRSLVEKMGDNQAELITGTKIHLVQLEDINISSSEIRKRLYMESDVSEVLAPSVFEYIEQEHLYERAVKKIGDFERLTRFCGELLFEKRGLDVAGFDVRDLNQPSEYTLIASGTSTRHVIAMCEYIVGQVKSRYGVNPQGVEGQREGRWIVIDYGSLIVHIFHEHTRLEYGLERIWQRAANLEMKDSTKLES